MNTYIYTGGSSLLTMKDNDVIRNEDLYNNFKLNKKYEESQNSGNCIKDCRPDAPCSEC